MVNPKAPVLSLSQLPNFDPRRIPVLGVDSHLPAVPASTLTPGALRERFNMPPAWEPELRSEKSFSRRSPQQAAVLIPITVQERLTVLLTERTAHLSTHSGQIAFPGGKVDPEDRDAAATAMREAQEEIGLQPHYVQVLGTLPQYVTGSAFVITPVVALIEPGFTLTPNAHEVADIFEVPLDYLMNPAHHQRHAFEWEGVLREWFSMPYPAHDQQRFIWGATAGMLRNFYRMLSA